MAVTEPRPWRDRVDCYGRISILLHWATALLVLALIALGLLMEWTITFDDQSLYGRIKYLHIGVGVVLAVLALPRVAWRVRSGWPALHMRSRALRFLARLVPCLLLAGIVLQAITGVFARWSARDWPGYEAASLPLFGVLEIPSPFDMHWPALNRFVETVHDTSADVVLLLLAVHVVAAVWHRGANQRGSKGEIRHPTPAGPVARRSCD